MKVNVIAYKALCSFLALCDEVNWISIFFFLPVSFVFGNWRVTSILVLVSFLFFICDKYFKSTRVIINFKIPMLLIFVTGIIAALRSPKFGHGQDYFIGTVLVPILLFIIITNIKLSYSGIIKFIHLSMFACVILSVVTIYLIYIIGSYNIRLSSLWQDVNIVATFFMIIFFFIFTSLVHYESSRQLLFYALILVPTALGMFFTQSRNVWLATMIALSVYVIKRPKVIVPALIFVGILISQFYSIILDRFLSVKYFAFDTSALGRFQAWLASILLIRDNWFWGLGFDAFLFLKSTVFYDYFFEIPHSHNTYLRLWLEFGLLGFLSYISFFFFALVYSFKLKKKAEKEKKYVKIIDALQLSFVGLTVSFMFEPYFSLYGVSTIIIWILISLTFNLYYNCSFTSID